MMEVEIRIRHEVLIDTIRQVLAREGVTESALLGVPSHGVHMLPGLVKTIRDGRCKAKPQRVVTRERGATCVLDCDNGPGLSISPPGERAGRPVCDRYLIEGIPTHADIAAAYERSASRCEHGVPRPGPGGKQASPSRNAIDRKLETREGGQKKFGRES
jgi:hypothetical protein